MTFPIDVMPDVSEATERAPRQINHRKRESPDFEQHGVAVAAIVAFLGIAYVGPALTRLLRRPTREDRMARQIQETRRQAAKASGRVRKRVRQLGGGTVRR